MPQGEGNIAQSLSPLPHFVILISFEKTRTRSTRDDPVITVSDYRFIFILTRRMFQLVLSLALRSACPGGKSEYTGREIWFYVFRSIKHLLDERELPTTKETDSWKLSGKWGFAAASNCCDRWRECGFAEKRSSLRGKRNFRLRRRYIQRKNANNASIQSSKEKDLERRRWASTIMHVEQETT